MPQSITDCCNNALQKLGMPRIMALTDDNRQARQCALAIDNNRRSELRKYKWNFAIKRVALTPDAESPAFDYLYQFTIPADCLRIIRPVDVVDIDWVVEGRKILSNCKSGNGTISVNLRYIADIQDPNLYDASFYEVLYLAMAIDMCEALTNSTSKKANLEVEYNDSVARARLANSFETGPIDPPEDSFITARF